MKKTKIKKEIKSKVTKKTKNTKTFKFKSRVIVWTGSGTNGKDDSGAWRFARVPEDISAKIKAMQKGKPKRGWGAVYVDAKVGRTLWRTSIFPDKRSATYLLPLKKEIRFEENLYDGVEFNFTISVFF